MLEGPIRNTTTRPTGRPGHPSPRGHGAVRSPHFGLATHVGGTPAVSSGAQMRSKAEKWLGEYPDEFIHRNALAQKLAQCKGSLHVKSLSITIIH